MWGWLSFGRLGVAIGRSLIDGCLLAPASRLAHAVVLLVLTGARCNWLVMSNRWCCCWHSRIPYDSKSTGAYGAYIDSLGVPYHSFPDDDRCEVGLALDY